MPLYDESLIPMHTLLGILPNHLTLALESNSYIILSYYIYLSSPYIKCLSCNRSLHRKPCLGSKWAEQSIGTFSSLMTIWQSLTPKAILLSLPTGRWQLMLVHQMHVICFPICLFNWAHLYNTGQHPQKTQSQLSHRPEPSHLLPPVRNERVLR